ncbi:winged helix-turn-helix domain-containing protein [Novosphingobium aquimarinum]|uniref:winged helix-turn-helix domain-containing protein n=1 Tax=Novosphingobium aquimarinum TaxID=2682494 RepID=UPI0012EB7483|nr:winged helix-turn-helix domain-containing protein [Novosphingobium aquimarinum]
MIAFDDFRLNLVSFQIFRGDEKLEAPPQIIEVLAYLIENHDRTVSRQELLDRFWARAGTGGDAALNTCIRRIRALLDDDVTTPRYVQTRPRAGYRFIGTIAEAEMEAAAPKRGRRLSRQVLGFGALAALAIGGATWAHVSASDSHHRIAIEPVKGMCEYVLYPHFNVGLRESFVAQATQILPADYQIVTSGEKADLHARVSVRQTTQRTVVTVTLRQASDGRILWSREFAAPTDNNDYVPLQQKLAREMAVSLERALHQRS